ncbi:MAG: DUF6544 family protein [Chloroflexales bacterium]
MKYLFLFIVVVHGLIHLMGFTKAFNLAQLEQLRAPITQPVGLLWLAAALLFLASAVLLLIAPDWWWLPAAGAVVISQGVIIASWSDAKFGTIANLIVLVPLIIVGLGHAPWSFRAQYERNVVAGLASPPAQVTLVTDADIAKFPAVVQKYLRFAGVVGKPRVWNYRLRFGGAMRMSPTADWMPITADQQSLVNPPTRLFIAEGSRSGLPFMAFHRYVSAGATFQVRAVSLVSMVDDKGPEINRAETVTLFNDMCLLAPATLIDLPVVWEAIDPQTVRATYTNAGNTISALLSFDERGAITNFVSDSRERSEERKGFGLAPTDPTMRWSTPVHEWRDFNGRMLPVKTETIWHLPSGEFAYGRFEILSIEYNVAGR